jgi:hypothetical protein
MARFSQFLNRFAADGSDDKVIYWILGLSALALGAVGVNVAIHYEEPIPLPPLEESSAAQTIINAEEFSSAHSFSTLRNGDHVLMTFQLDREESATCVAIVSNEITRNNRGESMRFPERVISKNPIATCTR